MAVEEARDASGMLPSPTHLGLPAGSMSCAGSENADGAGLKESTLRIVDVLKDTVSRCA